MNSTEKKLDMEMLIFGDVLYRNDGAVTSVVSIAGAKSLGLDPYGRWKRVESAAGTASFGYADWNGLAAVVTNGATVVEYAYDLMDRVTNVAWRTAGGESLGGIAYGYDALGRITARSLAFGGESFDRAYEYDGRDRLASDGGVAYRYDAAGNRLAKTGDAGGDVAYTLGIGDRLAAWTDGAYEYDAAGCVTRIRRGGEVLDLAWDGLYRLVSVSTNGVVAESCRYDPLGRRTETVNAEGTERHVWDGDHCLADLDEEGNVLRAYLWGPGVDNLLAVRVNGCNYAALTDIQGTVWGYADERGETVARWTYDAWGNVLSEEVSVPALAAVRYRFQGREFSRATGLTNFRARWYDSVTGRWISKDPIGLSGGLNLYAFCENDSLNKIDPMGLSWIDDNVINPIKDAVNNTKNAHWNRNNGLNDPSRLPQSPSEASRKGWRQLPRSESVYHNRRGASNSKFVSPDGHQEAVYDECGNLVTDSINQGTYNIGAPNDWFNHFLYDMLPYYLWGNSPDDASDFADRIKATYEAIRYKIRGE